MPPSISPSIPSQSSSVKVPSGTSVVVGGSQAPQPVAPPHVLAPVQAPNGVMIEQARISPALPASQSQAPLVGLHCWKVLEPTVIGSQANPGGHSIVSQSRPQNSVPS